MATILVVDDEEYIRSLLRHVLSQAGHTVLEAANGNEGLERFQQTDVDIVFTDLMMPGMGGLELIEALRVASAEVHIIAMSVLGHDAFPRARELGASSTFDKPFSVSEVLLAVDKLLDSTG